MNTEGNTITITNFVIKTPILLKLMTKRTGSGSIHIVRTKYLLDRPIRYMWISLGTRHDDYLTQMPLHR